LLHIVETLLVGDIIDHLHVRNWLQSLLHIIGYNHPSIKQVQFVHIENTCTRGTTLTTRQES
jgi:hypothetical protein